MADRSQHPGKIMETQTRFDLTAAIENWRQELAAQPDLTPEVRRELETHLRDTVAELQQRGLNKEESFWLARRRVGQPKQLCEEFAKADPTKIWRERMLWSLVGAFGVQLWLETSTFVWEFSIQAIMVMPSTIERLLPDWVLFYLPLPTLGGGFYRTFHNPLVSMFFSLVPMILTVILLSRGRMTRIASATRFLFESRRRFLFVSAALFSFYLLYLCFRLIRYSTMAATVPGNPPLTEMVQRFIAGLVLPITLLGLIAWLMPKGKSPNQRRA